MYTLGDVLRVLRRLGISVEEIKIPRDIYMYIIRQARKREYEEFEYEEGEEEEEH